jgi:hypothetical protein
MASIADILPAEENFLETMRDLGGSGGRFIWTISLQGGHWTIGWADEQNELIATGEGNLRGGLGSV